MILYEGVYLPDGEQHLQSWMRQNRYIVDGKITYQYHKLAWAVECCTQRRVCIDVGGHAGLWAMHLANRFQQVHSFEPVPEHRDCFRQNVRAENVMLYPYALGASERTVTINTNEHSSGDSWVKDDTPKDGEIYRETSGVRMVKLDSFAFDDVDFIKLDCEGYELFALRGGEETIKRCRPIIIVEQKPNRAEKYGLPRKGAVDYLQGLGYSLRKEYSGDFIMVPA